MKNQSDFKKKRNIVSWGLCFVVSIIAHFAGEATDSTAVWVLICIIGGFIVGWNRDALTRWLWWD